MKRRQLLTASGAVILAAGIAPTLLRRAAAATPDLSRNPLTAAAITFFTFADHGDDKKNGSTILCQLMPNAQPASGQIIFAQNDASATTPAFPDDNTWANQHGFPSGIKLTLQTDAPMYFADLRTSYASMTFVGVSADTWKTDFHIQLIFAGGQIVRRFKNGLLFNTTGGAHQGYKLMSDLAADPANHFG
jgi:hypothetical protein